MARSYRKLVAKLAPKPVQSAAPSSLGDRSTGTGFRPSFSPTPDPVSLNFGDPNYVGANAQGRLPFQQALARLPGDVGALASQFGYSVDFQPGQVPGADPAHPDPNDPYYLGTNPSPTVTGIDTSNPYSRAALLQKSYDQTKAGNTTSMASRGQLYSGALANAQGAAQTNFNTQSEGLRGQFDEQIRQWLAGLDTARTGAGAARIGALGPLTQQSTDNPAPTAYGGVPYQPNARGLLAPLAGAKPTAASVMASGSLAGTGAAGSGTMPRLRPGDPGYKKPRRR